MDRKDFLQSSLALAATLGLNIGNAQAGLMPVMDSHTFQQPPFLKPGSCIGICSPSGPIKQDELLPAIQQIESRGFSVRIGTSIGKKQYTFGGTDAERLLDLQQMLDDERIDAVLCARGGYGMIRILDKLDLSRFVKKPKWVIGFSDATVLHLHIHQLGVASIHSKMCNSFPANWAEADANQRASIEGIFDCLTGKTMRYTAVSHPSNRIGEAEGVLIGGNLRLLESHSGTASALDTRKKILFVEDADEYLYNIDRMFWHLKRSNQLQSLSGLIVGGFRARPDDPGEEFGMTVEEIVLEKVNDYSFPVCFGFPVGHQKHNMPLVCGMTHRLTVTHNGTLLEALL
jgi:muramoyltetrapeptide carboxypeptidase